MKHLGCKIFYVFLLGIFACGENKPKRTSPQPIESFKENTQDSDSNKPTGTSDVASQGGTTNTKASTNIDPDSPIAADMPGIGGGRVATSSDNPFFEGFTFLYEFKTLPQGHNNCGPAATRMMINYLTGTLVSEEQLAQEIRENDFIPTEELGNRVGTTAVGIQFAINKYLNPLKLKARSEQISEQEEQIRRITNDIDAGIPVIIQVETLARSMHWLVVIGYDDIKKRLLLANSGDNISEIRQGAINTGWYDIATYDEFYAAIAYELGAVANLPAWILEIAIAQKLAKNIMIDVE